MSAVCNLCKKCEGEAYVLRGKTAWWLCRQCEYGGLKIRELRRVIRAIGAGFMVGGTALIIRGTMLILEGRP